MALAEARLTMARAQRLAVARLPTRGAILVSVAEPDGYWLALAPLSPWLRARWRDDGTVPLHAGAEALPVTRDLRLATTRALGRALAHFADDGSALPGDVELALVLAAQHLLHGFAGTLPGFADSSPPFLYDHFLAFGATVEELGGRRICRLGRPPLATLLALTGAQRGRIELPWLGGAALELYPGG
jgi:hypothetical protein